MPSHFPGGFSKSSKIIGVFWLGESFCFFAGIFLCLAQPKTEQWTTPVLFWDNKKKIFAEFFYKGNVTQKKSTIYQSKEFQKRNPSKPEGRNQFSGKWGAIFRPKKIITAVNKEAEISIVAICSSTQAEAKRGSFSFCEPEPASDYFLMMSHDDNDEIAFQEQLNRWTPVKVNWFMEETDLISSVFPPNYYTEKWRRDFQGYPTTAHHLKH